MSKKVRSLSRPEWELLYEGLNSDDEFESSIKKHIKTKHLQPLDTEIMCVRCMQYENDCFVHRDHPQPFNRARNFVGVDDVSKVEIGVKYTVTEDFTSNKVTYWLERCN